MAKATARMLIDAFHDPRSYQTLHAQPGDFLDNPFQDGVICFRHDTLKTLSGHPLMQAAPRRPAGDDGPPPQHLSRMFDAHPVFQTEPDHQATRKEAFKLVAHDGIPALKSRLEAAFADRADCLVGKGRADLIADFVTPVVGALWSRIATGSEAYGAPLSQAVRPIGAMMRYDRPAKVAEAADEAARALLAFFAEAASGNPSLTAALSFDAIDGMGGMTANALWACAADPAIHAALRTDPTRAAAIWTEATRLTPAIQGLYRAPIEDLKLEFGTLRQGQTVLLLYAAGNRDPQTFDDPHTFDTDRTGPAPLTFGFGPRACLGRGLSKIAGCAALEALARRFDTITLTETVTLGAPGLGRTPERLIVTLA